MKRFLSAVVTAVVVCGLFAGCSSGNVDKAENQQTEQNTQTETTDDVTINVAMLKGPTGIGAVELMEKSENGEAEGNYNISVASAADDVTAKIISGEVDIAEVPTNLADVLYNKTEGGISVIGVNTLGVLYVVENGDSINSINDLSGKTVYSSGQGAVPEYVMDYVLEKNNVTDVDIEYMSEHAEVATAMADGTADIALLTEPNVTAVTMKNPDLRIALDMTEEWNKVSDSDLAMGCVIVRNYFLNEHEGAVKTFIKEYAESIDYVNSNVSDAAQLVEKYEIMASAAAAEKAIPNCNIVFEDGENMKAMLNGLYDVLYKANPKSVGGSIPSEDFYYENN